jgi:hypothetical protein
MTSQYFGKEDFGNGKCKRICWWNQVELHGGVHEILSFTEKMAASNTREAAPAWLNCTAINTNNLKEIHDKIRVLNLNAMHFPFPKSSFPKYCDVITKKSKYVWSNPNNQNAPFFQNKNYFTKTPPLFYCQNGTFNIFFYSNDDIMCDIL